MNAPAAPATSPAQSASSQSQPAAAAPVLLFDGVCNVCSALVRFVLEHERQPYFKFASLQSDVALRLLQEHGIPADLDTFVIVDGGRVYTKSSAAVHSLRFMRAPWSWLAPFAWIIPKPLRDVAYTIFARNRYRLFGKKETCMVPTPELRARFL